MKLTTKQLTLCAVLTALALAFSYLENFFPLSLAIPIPGIKLGLANIVTVFALYALGPAQALLILTGRCLLGAVFAGNMNALIFSLLGGFSAMLVMILLSRSRHLIYLRCVRRWRGGSQLRPDRRSLPDAGFDGPAVLSANSAGGFPDHRSGDGRGGGLLVSSTGPYEHFPVTKRTLFRRMERWLTFLQRGATLNLL